MKLYSLLLLSILYAAEELSAFAFVGSSGAVLAKQRQQLSSTVRFATSNRNENNANNRKARTCVRNFLTQRSLQSFMWLLEQMRDPHTNIWLENFLGTKNLLSYYGSAALDLDERFIEWDCVLKELCFERADVVIVEFKARGPGKGLSKNNPYRKKEEDAANFEIEIDIDPASLANRILSVRTKIAKEWASDLELVISANDNILPSYMERNKDARKSKDKKFTDNKKDSRNGGEKENESSLSGDTVESSGDFKFGQRTLQRFDRDAVYFVNNHPSFSCGTDSSPLRASSFDLLFLLSLQESIHRILQSYKDAGEEKEVSFAWLRRFYIDSLEKYFDGNQSFGRADDFMDVLLGTPPALKTINDKIGFIDPLSIAEDIISVREEVAIEWKELMENVELDHTEIRADIFRVQMEKWGQQTFEPKLVKKKEVQELKKKKRKKNSIKKKSIIIQGGDFE